MAKPLKFNAEPIVPKIEPVKPTTGYQSVGIQKSEIPNKPLPAGQQYVLQSDGSYKSFAKPTGLSPAPQPEPVFDGGIKYKATGTKGVYTNAQGQYVNASGKLVDAPEPDTISGVVKQTYAEQAESQMRGQFKTDYENALKYGITLPYKTFEEYKDYIQGGKQDNLSYLQKQQDLARGVEDLQTQTALEGIEAAKKGVTSAMAQSREGAVTTSKPQFTQEFASQMQRQVDQIKLEKASAEAQRQQAVAELKRAQESGDVELAQSIQGQLSAIDSNLRQIDTQALQASTLANQQALDLAKFESDKSIAEQAASRANLESFTSMVDLGTEMTTEGIMQFSKSLNVPFEAAYNYYAGSQKVRDDKNLSQEEKVLKNAQLKQDLNDTITGQNIATVKQWSILEQMYKSGASEEEISRAKDAFGFKDENDPIYKLDLEKKQLENDIARRQSQGIPVTIDDYAKYFDIVQQQNELYGSGGQALVPTGSLEGISTSFEGGKLNITQEGGLKPYQCGAWVNRVWGLASGSGGGMGDTYQSKLDLVNNRGIAIGELNEFNFAQIIKPGMAFVSETGTTGHTGIVTMVDPAGKMFKTLEANVGDSDYTKGDPPIEKTHFISENGLKGFVYPPNYSIAGTTKDSADFTADQITMFKSWDGKKVPDAWGGNKQDFLDSYNAFKEKTTDPNISLEDKMRYTVGGKELLAQQVAKMDSFATVVTGLQNLEERLADVSTDDIAPIFSIIQNNNPWDDKRKEIDAIITSITPGLARGVYGEVGVLTDTDIARYQSLLPTLKDQKSQREALMSLLKESLKQGVENTVRSAAASGRDVSDYADLVQYVSSKTTDESQPANPWDDVDVEDDNDILNLF